MLELSKKDKKAARLIIEKGLHREFENGIIELEKIIGQWRDQKISGQETWGKLYVSLNSHKRHIARRYDGLRGSRYQVTIVSQLTDGVINADDLESLNEETRVNILRSSELI
jgi:hypothetical protein